MPNDYLAFINGVFADSQNLDESEFDNDSFIVRDILLYSWLLYEHNNVVRRAELCKYVSPSGEQAIEAIFYSVLRPRRIASIENGVYRFPAEALEAIAQAFDNPQHGYKLFQQVPFWDNGITGKHLVQYFCQLENPSVPLIELTERAFRNLLINFQVSRSGNLLHISRGRANSFYVYVSTTNGTLRTEDVNRIYSDLGVLGATQQSLPILVCSANTDNNEANQRLRDLPMVYGVWSIELVSLFHYMQDLINEFDQQKVANSFLRIFPPNQRSFFSARHAAKRVRDAL